MKTSPEVAEIAKALAAAQARMKNPAFDAKNPHFNSKYATLAAIRDVVVPALAASGIAVTQEVTSHEHGIAVITTLWHSSGQWLASEHTVVPVTKDDAQGVVAASTYGRRTALSSIACVVGDDDDDGEMAAARAPQGKPTVKRQDAPQAPVIETKPSFLSGFANAMQAAATTEQLVGFWKGAAAAATSRGSSPEEVEKLRPLFALQDARFALGQQEFTVIVELHHGKMDQPKYGLSAEGIAKLADALRYRLEKST